MRDILTNLILQEVRVPKSERVNIYRDDRYVVVRPLTHRASCKYGAYTQWCISVPSEDDLWDEVDPNDTIVIMVIDRKYEMKDQDKISRLSDLHDKEENEGLSEEEKDKYLNLMIDDDAHNMEKVVVVLRPSGAIDKIFDLNNLEITDNYSTIFSLPYPDELTNAVWDYVEDLE